MSSDFSELSQINSQQSKPAKTKQQYSRNVKKLKIKLATIHEQIESIQKKMKTFTNTSNDKIIALKILKFCKQRRMTPQMLFRCADREHKNIISKNDFKQTLKNIGMKLTQNQLTRLEYLLDQDISGQISLKEYKQFLIAFGINRQYTSDQLILKDLWGKLDITKIIDGVGDKKKKKLLNYEEFLKYCRENFPKLKEKQVATIFNILKRNQLIDIDDFLDYVKRKDQQQRLKKKNTRNQQQLQVIDDDDPKTLKGLLKLILKNRKKDSKALFHTLQFTKVQKISGRSKLQLLNLFKQIDKQKRGSFDYSAIIQFYIQKQKQNPSIIYAYELMGRKMYVDQQMPDDVLHRYNGGAGYKKMTLEQFKNFMMKEYNVGPSDATATFKGLQKKYNEISIKRLIQAMKLDQSQKKLIYIKPTAWKTQSKDFWKRNCFTILFNPFIALRFCLQIQQEIKKQMQSQEIKQKIYWNDFEFGPTFQDPFGVDSLHFNNITSDDIKWQTTQSLGMNNFYSGQNIFQSPATIIHQKFTKVLYRLNKQNPNFLWNKQQIDFNTRKIQQRHLLPLFEGLYPLVFQRFAQLGIYVFRFYSRQKWVYVLIDNKIPCNNETQPLFTYEKGKKNSWVSLIQKAYAKLKGNYNNLFAVNSTSLYIHQLNRKLPISIQISRQLITSPTQQLKNNLWNRMNHQIKLLTKDNKMYGLVSDLAVQQLIQNKAQTGLVKNMLYEICKLLQIFDQKSQNKHKSHRLLLMKLQGIKDQNLWNINWNSSKNQNNKYDIFNTQIRQLLKKQDSQLLLNQCTILNFKLFRSIFDYLYILKKVQFQKMIILRKIVQFQQKHICKYEVKSKLQNKQSLQLIITLNKIRSPQDTEIQLCLKGKQGTQIKQLQKIKYNSSFKAYSFQITQDTQFLQIRVLNWHSQQDHIYNLTFYFDNPQYHLKQLDRQLLFKYVGQYEEMYYMDIKQADEKERKYLLTNYFKAADRSGGCCG